MKSLLLLGLCLLVVSCNSAGSYHRGYVISKSHEQVSDSEPEHVTEPLSE